jgi:hypothetical protein
MRILRDVARPKIREMIDSEKDGFIGRRLFSDVDARKKFARGLWHLHTVDARRADFCMRFCSPVADAPRIGSHF